MLSRRTFHWLCFGSVLSGSVGCRGESQESATEADNVPQTPSRPLRLWLAAAESDAEIIRRGWASISTQELMIDVIPWDRLPKIESRDDFSESWNREDTITEASKSCDLFIGPHVLLADLVAAKAIVPLADDATARWVDGCFPALRGGLCSYGGETYCLPISSAVPSLITTDAIDECENWISYDKLVQSWGGAAAEPTAAGWAAMSFLWRAIGHVDRWLFDQKSFESLISAQEYVDVLNQMKMTCDRYSQQSLAPTEIAAHVISGKLTGGIGFPAVAEDLQSSLLSTSASFLALPGHQEASSVLLDTMSPVIALSANCRQSAASKTFMRWICGGEGSATTRGQLPGVFPVANSSEDQDAANTASPYNALIKTRLSQPVSTANLTILQGHQYYRALDQGIRDCLSGNQSAADTLGEVNDRWNAITQKVGAEKQARSWRRAKGMSA